MILNKSIFNRILLYAIIIIDSVVPLIIWPFGEDYFYYPKLASIYFLIALIILVCLTFYRSLEFRLQKEFIPLLLYIVLIIFSAAFSQYKLQAFMGTTLRYEGAVTFVLYFMILFFTYISAQNANHAKYIISSLLISSSIISIYALCQYMGIDIISRDYMRQSWIYISFATLGNPNFLGSYLSMMFPIAICLYAASDNRKFTPLYFILSVLLYSALICSRARSAWIGTGITIFVLSFAYYRKLVTYHKRIIMLLITCMVITYLLNNVHNGMISSKFFSLIEDYKIVTGYQADKMRAGTQRIFIWSRTLENIFNKPILGYGPDTFDKVFVMTSEEAVRYFGSSEIYVDKAHNEYLQIIVTMGFPAFFSYSWFLYLAVHSALKRLSSLRDDIYLLGLLSAVISYLLQAFFNISVVSVAPVYWSILGLLIASYSKNKNRVSN